METPGDPHSYARPGEAVVKHLRWKATLDFSSRQISAVATWLISSPVNADSIIFDTKGLSITSVTLGEFHTPAAYSLHTADSILGSALSVKLDSNARQINIAYTTSPDAQALQWLEPAQTAGKKHPFFFTQSQAILARTWIPVQDSPGIRFTYEAEVTVPAGYMALMSAENPTVRDSAGVYRFRQEKAIPAYLMALAAGDIDFRSLGGRTGVYAEPSMLEKAASEFEGMEKMLNAAESLYGPYAWKRYDVLVLPPSFPFGGMENPMLTFATPTIIAGDRSLVSLIAHELAHSWSGNLVTNVSWDDFWLNEGFTVYFERRIMESVEGRDYADMLAYLGYDDLQNTLEEYTSAGHPEDTHLKLKLKGRDPDEGMSDIAYEKGYLFLVHIEKAVGRDKFDAFLKNYFREFAFLSMSTEGFLRHLRENLIPEGSELNRRVGPEKWIYEAGIPDGVSAPTSSRFLAVESEAGKFLSGAVPSSLQTGEWSSHEWQYFLRFLGPNLTKEKMTVLDREFEFTSTGNSEIAALWFEAAIDREYEPAYAALEKFLLSVGRRKFIKPLYEAMQEKVSTREMGKRIYARARPGYHPVSVGTIDKIVGYSS